MPVPLEKAVVARLNRFGMHFEVLVDPDAAQLATERLRAGDKLDDKAILDLLAVDDVFIHWSDGTRASREEKLKGFETDHFATIARRILEEGEIQLTADQRKRMTEQKHKRIVEYIVRNSWNPQAKAPHPKDRIERALEEAKFRVDPLRRVEEQVDEAMKRLRPIIPIAFEKVRVAIRLPAEHAGHCYGLVRGFGELKQEEWQSDGALIVLVEIPAGIQAEVYERLNHATHGNVTTKLVGVAR